MLGARTAYSWGVGKMISAGLAYTKGDPVAAQMAAFFVSGGETFHFSHDFAVLPVAQGVAHVEGRPIKTTLTNKNELTSSVMDYRYRPVELDNLNWYEYLENWEVKKKKKGRLVEDADDEEEAIEKADAEDKMEDEQGGKSRYNLHSSHVLADTHEVRRRACRAVPLLSGRRVPNLRRLDDDMSETDKDELKQRYASTVLVSFVPWRTRSDLRMKDGSFTKNSFEDWLELHKSCTQHTKDVIANIQGYHVSIVRNADDEVPADVEPYVLEEQKEDELLISAAEAELHLADAAQAAAEKKEDDMGETIDERLEPYTKLLDGGYKGFRTQISDEDAVSPTAEAFSEALMSIQQRAKRRHVAQLQVRAGLHSEFDVRSRSKQDLTARELLHWTRTATADVDHQQQQKKSDGERPEEKADDAMWRPTIGQTSRKHNLTQAQHTAAMLGMVCILDVMLNRVDRLTLTDSELHELHACRTLLSALLNSTVREKGEGESSEQQLRMFLCGRRRSGSEGRRGKGRSREGRRRSGRSRDGRRRRRSGKSGRRRSGRSRGGRRGNRRSRRGTRSRS